MFARLIVAAAFVLKGLAKVTEHKPGLHTSQTSHTSHRLISCIKSLMSMSQILTALAILNCQLPCAVDASICGSGAD